MIKELIDKRNVLIDKADKKQEEIEKAEKLRDRYKERANWIKSLLHPIAKAIIEKEGFIDGFQIMGPFGLTSSASIWMWKTEEDFQAYKDREHPEHENWAKKLKSITFRPQGYRDENDKYRMSLAVVNYNHESKEYPEGSIGHLNGFQHESINIDDWDLDTLIAFMYESKENG
jgi:heme-degrading monooxygenase HmoA